MNKYLFILILIITSFAYNHAVSQDEMFFNSKISGNFQVDMQSYTRDTLIGAENQDEKVLSNGFLWLNYTSNNFNAGMRYENYMNPLLGIDERYTGNGIAFRWAEFNSEIVDITAGNFYEQFGTGMIFRTYQEYALGYDNAMDGLRVKFRPLEGVEFKGMIGKQRKFWTQGTGIIRGGDLNLGINELIPDLLPEDYNLSIGGSVVSKFQEDASSLYNLPQNVLMWAGRMALIGSSFSFDGEYGYKNPDPSSTNNFNFNPGNALQATASYFTSGFGASLNFHRNDNMDIRSDRDEVGNVLLMNFLPPITKQHTYTLAALYPYATQLNGEIGLLAEITYTIPKKTLIGGEYGTTISLNYSRVHEINKTPLVELSMDTTGNKHVFTYDSPFLEFGERLYYEEYHVEISRKLSKDLKAILTYIHQIYDKDIVQVQGAGEFGKLNNDIFVADVTYKLSDDYALRIEAQNMFSVQDSAILQGDRQNGDWLFGLAELTISPNWYFSIADQWNYGNVFDKYKIHYTNASFTYIHDATRFTFGYGKQREGIICVGGVCRQVPAANGFFLSMTSSF